MERLTDKREADAQRREYEKRLENGYPRNIPEERYLKLAAYEDTGLEPEEVKEREAVYIEIMTRTYGPLHQKISQWLQAEKDGRLVVLPCKVGDKVYRVITTASAAPIITEIEIKTLGQAVDLIGRIGEKQLLVSWYLTREEAEAALKKREED